ncbi:MAG TPA: MFS transporter [Thermoplasmata archaeon]|nr:MFS transporter [Thermoplasmata archaeon]
MEPRPSNVPGDAGIGSDRRLPHDVWAVSITSLFSDWSYEMLLPILPFFLALDLGASPLVVGLVEGAAVFAQSVAQFLSGRRLAQRADRRTVGTAGYATTTLAHGLIAAVTAWPYAAVLRVVAWSARGERQPIKKAILADASRTVGAGRSFGLEQMFDSLGAVAGTVSAVVVVFTQGLPGFRTIFAVSVVPGVVAVLLFYRLVWDRAPRPASGAGAPGAARAPFPRRFRWFLVAASVFGLAFFNILLGLLRVGTGLLGAGSGSPVDTILVALVAYLAYNLVYTGLSYPAGLLADRFPRIGLVALSYLLFVPVDLLFVQSPTVLVGLLAFLVAGVQIALSDVTQSAWISRAVAPGEVGHAFGWFGAVQGVTSLISSVLIGALWTAYSAPLAFSVSAGLAVIGAGLLLPVALEDRRRRPS